MLFHPSNLDLAVFHQLNCIETNLLDVLQMEFFVFTKHGN